MPLKEQPKDHSGYSLSCCISVILRIEIANNQFTPPPISEVKYAEYRALLAGCDLHVQTGRMFVRKASASILLFFLNHIHRNGAAM